MQPLFIVASMSVWWGQMGGLEHFFWIVATFASVFTIVMLFASLLGLSHEGDVDHDFHIDHDHGNGGSDHESGSDIWQLFTLKNLLMFFVGFSWTGVVGCDSQWPTGVIFITSVAAGLFLATLFALIFKKISQLGESGNIENYDSCLNKIGVVYLPIEAKNGNVGKVQITVAGRIREVNAITDDEERLPTYSQVKVTKVSGDTLVVTKQL